MKKELRNLRKDRNSEVYLIKYVSKLLRNVTNKKNNNIIYTSDHDKEIKENFWGYTKSFLEKDDSKKPIFTKQTCTNFFKRVFNSTTPLFTFAIPSWFTKFRAPIHAFNDTPATYSEITNIVRKMKYSGHLSLLIKSRLLLSKGHYIFALI